MKKLLLLTTFVFLAIAGFSQSYAIIGTANLVTPTNAQLQSQPTPYNRYWEGRRTQIVYTAAELSAAGLTANSQITALAWDVSVIAGGGANAFSNYTIRMAHTTATNAASHNSTALTTVRNAATLGAGSVGWNDIPFNNAFTWDGTSNILVDVCWQNAAGAWSNNGRIVFYNSSTNNERRGIWGDGASFCGTNTSTSAAAKPRVRLKYVTSGPLTYVSSTTTQNTTSVAPNNTNQQIIGVQVTTSGTTGTLNLTQLNLNITGSTSAADITNAKVFYTGTSASFAATNQFGTTANGPTGAFNVTGSQSLASGTNYFWITYDVPSTATLGNVLDAQCTSITINGTPYTPTITAPTGNRTIALTYCTFSSSFGACYLNGLLNDYGLYEFRFNNVQLYYNTNCVDAIYINNYNSSPACTVTAGDNNVPIYVERYFDSYSTYMYVYVDWQNDGNFTSSGDLIFSPFITSGYSASGTINVPANATAGDHRVRVVSAYNNPAPCSATQATAYDFKITVQAATPMSYVSNSVVQVTGNVAPGTADQPVLNVKINTTGSSNPISLNSIANNSIGCTNISNDVTEARVFYTGSASTFSYGSIISQVGTAVVSPGGTMSFTGNTQLVEGENNFWLVYSVSQTAVNANLIDAQITDIVVDNISRTANPSAPTGAVVIASPAPFCTSGLYNTGCDNGSGPLDGFTNVGLNGVNNPSTCGAGGYSDFTGNTPYTLYKGQSNLFTVTNPAAASANYSMAMYIDQNGNGTFEDGEMYLSLGTASQWAGGTLVGNFTLPNILQPGLRRMRIRCSRNNDVESGYQCNVYNIGEIEDYMVNILENPGVAQVGCGYTATNSTQAYSAISGGTTIATGGAIDDQNYPNQPIGFNFDFNGNIYTSVGVSANGYIWFGSGTPSGTTFNPIGNVSPNLGGTGTIDGVAAAYGADIFAHQNTLNNSSIKVQTTGTSPNRVFTVQWENFQSADTYNNSANCWVLYYDDHRLDFQIKLYENNGEVRFVYANQDSYCIDAGSIAQVGLRGSNAADFNVRKLTSGQQPNAATAGTSFLDQFVFSASRYFTGNTSYLFTPALVTPIITAAGSTEFCAGGAVSLSTTTTANTYQWFESGLIEAGQTANNYSVNQTGVYHIRVGNSGACFRQSDPINVTVYDLPDLVSTPTTACEPDTVNLASVFTDNNNTTGNVTYFASLTDANNDTNPINGSIILTNGTYYIKKSTVPGGCSDITSVAVTMYESPKLVIADPTIVCAPLTVDITASGVATDLNNVPGTLTYYPTEQDAIAGTNPLANPAAISTAGTYWIRKTANAGGCVDVKPVVVSINTNCGPVAYAITGSNSCNSSNIGVANFEAGVSYQLYNGANPVGAPITTGTVGNPISFGTQTAAGTYTVIGTNISGSTTMTGSVVVYGNPAVPSGLANQERCLNGNVTFTANDPGVGYEIQWSTDGVNNNGGVSLTYTVALNPGSPVTMYARTHNLTTNCFSVWAPVVGTAYPAANPNASALNTSVCFGDPINLTSASMVSYSWTGPNGFVSASQNPTINNASLAANGTYNLNVVDVHGCSGSGSVSIVVGSCGTVIWTGATSTNWNDGTNWSGGFVPTALNDVIIPDVGANDPILTTGPDGAVRSINISVGVPITVNTGKKISVKGNWSGNANQLNGAGALEFNGSLAQTITGGGAFSNLSINNSNGVTIASGNLNQVKITTSLNLMAGQLTGNNNIYLVSTATQTAYINNFTTLWNGTISGNITMERYNPGATGFRYLSMPVNNPSITEISEVGLTGQNMGQLIPTATCSPSNLASNSPYGNVMEWHENGPFNPPGCRQSGWYVRSAGTLENFRGYLVKMHQTSSVVVKGTPNLTSQTYATNLDNTNATGDGWHLMGNPYPSPVQWTGVSGFGDMNLFSTVGIYTGTYASFAPVQNKIIASMQGFFVRRLSAGGMPFGLSNASRRAVSNVTYQSSADWFDHLLEIDITGNGFGDHSTLYFNSGATADYEAYFDARKMDGRDDQPAIYTHLPNGTEQLGVNGLGSLDQTYAVPLVMKPGQNGEFTLNFSELVTFPASAMIYLEDLQTGTLTDLRVSPSYTFTSDINDNPERFIIRFEPPVVATVADATCETAGSIEVTQAGNTVWSNYQLRDNNNNIHAQGSNFSGSITFANLAAQEYILKLTHPSGYNAEEFFTVNGASTVLADMNVSDNSVAVNEVVTFTANVANANELVWNFGDGEQAIGTIVSHSYAIPGNYAVVLTASNDVCENVASDVVNVSAATGVNENTAETLVINGYGAQVTVEFNNWGANKADIFVFNTLGQRVESFTGVSTVKGRQLINIADVKPGYYFIQVVSNGKVHGKKVYLGE